MDREKESSDAVKALHMLNGSDIPLPGDQAASISPELQKALKHEGLTAIYDLNGSTIAQQKAEGSKFGHITPADNNGVLRVPSLVGTVAFDPRPNKFFLPKSNRLTLDEQLEMTAEYSDKLQRKLGTKEIVAVLHEAPTYSALAFAHLQRTTKRLFGEEYGFNYTRTITSFGRVRRGGRGPLLRRRWLARRRLGSRRSQWRPLGCSLGSACCGSWSLRC